MAKAHVLVVDDQLLNIRLLERKLEWNDMRVTSTTNGPDALRLARELQPDVILLDVMMPGMDGIEVCRRLKADPATHDIPVIFITARTAKEEKIAGLDVGAADYLIKPVELDETLARVRTQLRIVQEHRENLRLTRQLEQSRRQAALMHLTEGIAHNLNNLLGVMVGYVNLLQRNATKPEKVGQHCAKLEEAIQRMTRIVQQLTVIGQFTSLHKQPEPLARILTGAVARFHRSAGTDNPVEVCSEVPQGFVLATNRELLEACLERLLHNAWESYAPERDVPPAGHGEITLTAQLRNEQAPPRLEINVLDRGRGIDPAIRDSVFEPFVTSSAVIGRGMGLTIARHSVTCLGGTIELLDRPEGGTRARILLPLTAPESAEP